MRLRSVIMAATTGVPTVALAYDPKVLHVARQLGGIPCLELPGLTVSAVTEALDEAWRRRDTLPARGRAVAAELAARATRNDELAIDLIKNPPAIQRRPEARRILDYLTMERLQEPHRPTPPASAPARTPKLPTSLPPRRPSVPYPWSAS